MFQLQGKMFYISCKILQRMKHTQQRPSFMDPEAWLLFIFRPKRINFIIRRLIIILIYYTPYADVEPSQEQIHLCNTAKVWALCIDMLCLSIYISMPYLFISVYYRVLPSFNSSQLTSDRLTHLSSFTLEETVPRGRGEGGPAAGHDIRPLQSWLVQGFISMGSFASPSSLKSLRQRIADRGNGWVSFQCDASTCLIIQGHSEQINRTTVMYGEVDNMCVSGGGAGGGGVTQTHTCTGSGTVCYLSSWIRH